MIRLQKKFGFYKIYTIDDDWFLSLDAKEGFIEALAHLLEEEAKEGFYLGAITQFHGEQVVIFKASGKN